MFANEEDVSIAKEDNYEYWVDADSPHLGEKGGKHFVISTDKDEELFNKEGELI